MARFMESDPMKRQECKDAARRGERLRMLRLARRRRNIKRKMYRSLSDREHKYLREED